MNGFEAKARFPLSWSNDEPFEYRVSYDPEDSSLIEIEEYRLTSASKDARAMRSPSNRSVALTLAEARWVHQALGEAIKVRELHEKDEDAKEIVERTCE